MLDQANFYNAFYLQNLLLFWNLCIRPSWDSEKLSLVGVYVTFLRVFHLAAFVRVNSCLDISLTNRALLPSHSRTTTHESLTSHVSLTSHSRATSHTKVIRKRSATLRYSRITHECSVALRCSRVTQYSRATHESVHLFHVVLVP